MVHGPEAVRTIGSRPFDNLRNIIFYTIKGGGTDCHVRPAQASGVGSWVSIQVAWPRQARLGGLVYVCHCLV